MKYNLKNILIHAKNHRKVKASVNGADLGNETLMRTNIEYWSCIKVEALGYF